MKYAVIDLQWDGAPPLPRLLRVIARELVELDPGYLRGPSGEPFAASDLTDKGARLTWYKHGDGMGALPVIIGYHHPCKVRWQEHGGGDDEPSEQDAISALETTPWILSRTQGKADAAGRIGRHPGGTGRVYGRKR